MKQIKKNIEMVRSFNAIKAVEDGKYFELITDETSGLIPVEYRNIFLKTGYFETLEDDVSKIKFCKNDQSFKENAITEVIEALIEADLIPRANVPRVQYRNIGGKERLTKPEFVINRAYDGNWGFPLDGVVILAYKINEEANKPEFLLQKRSSKVVFGNSYDFTAGGAIIAPQTVDVALKAQMKDEMGLEVTDAKFSESLSYSYPRPTKTKQVMRLDQRVYTAEIDDTNPVYHNFEVDGYEWADAETILDYIREEKFAASHVPAIIATLDKLGMLPEFANKAETLTQLETQGLRNKTSSNKVSTGLKPRQ